MDLFKILGIVAVETDEANRALENTSGNAEKSEGRITSAFKKIGAAVATYFAVDKIINFGKECVNMAAEVSAEISAFEQIMGDYSDEAADKVGAIAKATGMVDSRLKPYMTSMTAKFSGLGYGIDEATTLATDGLTIAADAAAFWDMSLDESMSHLNSFINGSYEGGEAIGLFANDTQMAAYAVESGLIRSTKQWAKLDEATKQATRLDYAQNMMELSGATGQAAKEADQYANVKANLLEKWRQFQALIGEPLLQDYVIPAMEKLSGIIDALPGALEWLNEKLEDLKTWLSDIGTYATEQFQPIFEDVQEVFVKVKDAAQPFIDKLIEYVTSGEAAEDITSALKEAIDFLAEAYATTKELIGDVVQGFQDAITWATEHETAVTLLGIAFGTLATMIGAYTAAQAISKAGGVVYLAQLAATAIGVYALDAAEKIATISTTAFGAAMAFVTSPVTLVILAIGALIAIIVLCVKHWDEIEAKVVEVAEKIAEKVEEARAKVEEKFEEIRSKIEEKINSAKETVTSIFAEIKDEIQNKIEEARDKVDEAIEKIKGFFDFEWSLPALKLPHFTIDGSFSLNPPSVPKFGIDWYAKGGVLEEPTIFGMNGNRLMGGGEAGAEAVAPIDVLQGYVAEAVASQNAGLVAVLERILEAILAMDANMGGNLREALDGTSFSINHREFGRLVKAVN